MATKYIECRHSNLVRCKTKDSTFDFYPFILNKYTGTPDHTGFTAVTEEQLAALEKESKVFAGFVKQKLLLVRDEVPASSQTPQGLLAQKDAEIAKLRKELAEAGGEGLVALKTENGKLRAELDETRKQLASALKGSEAVETPKDKKGKKDGVPEDGAPAQF